MIGELLIRRERATAPLEPLGQRLDGTRGEGGQDHGDDRCGQNERKGLRADRICSQAHAPQDKGELTDLKQPQPHGECRLERVAERPRHADEDQRLAYHD